MFFDEEDGGNAQLPSFSILARRVDDAFPTAAALFAEDLADGTKPWTPFEVFEAMFGNHGDAYLLLTSSYQLIQ